MRRRLRKFTLWTGTLLCVLIAAAFVVSGWWLIAAQAGQVVVDVASGSIGVGVGDSSPPPPGVNRHLYGLSSWNLWRSAPRWVR